MTAKTIYPKQVLDAAWEFYFAAVKAVLTLLFSGVRLLVLLLFILAQWLMFGADWLHSWLRAWTPIKPHIFDFGG